MRIKDNVFISRNVSFTNDKYPRYKSYLDNFLQTIIKKGVSIVAEQYFSLHIGMFSIICANAKDIVIIAS